VAYVIGFFVLLLVLDWHPDAKHKAQQATPTAAAAAVPGIIQGQWRFTS